MLSGLSLAQDNKITDTTAADARRGKDIQGIPWERLSISREKYRQTRLEQYKNYENIPQSGEGSEKVMKLWSVCLWMGSFTNLNIIPLSFIICLQLGMQAHKERGEVL